MTRRENKSKSPGWDLKTFDGQKKNSQKKLKKHRFGKHHQF